MADRFDSKDYWLLNWSRAFLQHVIASPDFNFLNLLGYKWKVKYQIPHWPQLRQGRWIKRWTHKPAPAATYDCPRHWKEYPLVRHRETSYKAGILEIREGKTTSTPNDKRPLAFKHIEVNSLRHWSRILLRIRQFWTRELPRANWTLLQEVTQFWRTHKEQTLLTYRRSELVKKGQQFPHEKEWRVATRAKRTAGHIENNETASTPVIRWTESGGLSTIGY